MGKKERSAGLVSAAMPQSRPKPNQAVVRVERSKCSVSKKTRLSSKAERVVSQIHLVDQNHASGNKAQVHAAQTPTVGPNVFCPMKKIVTQVRAEKTLFRLSMTKAEVTV
jgi:hypothetical protein